MSHEFQSHYFCPSRLLPAEASGIGNRGTVKKKRRKLVIKKSIVSNETEMPKRFKCFHCSRKFATTNGRASHERQAHGDKKKEQKDITSKDMEQKRRAGIIKAYMNRMNFGQGCLAHMVANLHTDQQFRKEIAYWLDWHPNRQWCWPAGEKIWKWFLDTENRRNLGMAMMPNRCAKMVGSLFFFLIQLRRDCSENTHFNRTTNTHTHRFAFDSTEPFQNEYTQVRFVISVRNISLDLSDMVLIDTQRKRSKDGVRSMRMVRRESWQNKRRR